MRKHIVGALVVLIGLSGCSHAKDCCGPILAPGLPLPDAPDMVKRRAPVTTLASAVVDTVHFDTDKAYLSDDAKDILWRQAQWLIKNDDQNVVVDGHCDFRSTESHNFVLGMKRANAVRDYLVKAGVDESRVSVTSSGESDSIAQGSDTVSLSLNRRAVTIQK